jgi:phosphoglycerate dehydrogenase-like enzyme
MRTIIFALKGKYEVSDRFLESVRSNFADTLNIVDAAVADRRTIEAAEGYIGWPSDETLRVMKRLRWLQLPSAGANHFAHHPLLPESVVLTNARGVFGTPGAEHILALILALARNIPLYVRRTERHIWEMENEVRQLDGATAVVIGYGNIGVAAAARLRAFGCRILAVKRSMSKVPGGADAVYDFSKLDEALRQSDIIIDVLPLTDETEHIFNKGRFDVLKKGALFINAGRGRTVDEEALIAALRSGQVGGAGLDVAGEEPLPPTHPLWSAPNVLITSHSLGAGTGKITKREKLIRENLARFRDGRPLINAVDRRLGY